MTNVRTMTLFRAHTTNSSYLVCLILFVTRTLEGTLVDDGSFASPAAESQSEDGGRSSGREQRSFGHSSKIDARNNSPALNNFLEDVLGAQEELKWIDRAVHRSNDGDKDFQGSSGNSRKHVNGKSRREYNEQPRKLYKPQRIYLEDEIKTKREVERNENSSSSSLAALKRTILELSDSLSPREREVEKQNGANLYESRRKLLSFEDLRSALGVAIEYYDYEDNADSAPDMLDNPVEQEIKREDSRRPLGCPSVKSKILKKDENGEEERKEERERQKLKNKYPKQEFISDTEEHGAESVAPSSKNFQESAPASSNSMYSSMVLKRIPAAPDSDDSDFYTQCEVGSLPDESEVLIPEGKSIILESQDSPIDSEKMDIAAKNGEPHLSGERTYFVISSKRSRKRSVDPRESSSIVGSKSWPSSRADKSARNYLALKITDDMFKGGVEQSNPLGEDKPIESTSFSSSTFLPSSASGNSFLSLRSHKTKTTSPEWKVIEAVEDSEKMLQPKNSIQPKWVFGRRLTQVIRENLPSHANFSSVSPFSPTDNKLYSTTLTHRHFSSPITENASATNVTTSQENVFHVNSGDGTNFSTTHLDNVDQQSNYQEVFQLSSSHRKNMSLQPFPTTSANLYNTTFDRHESNFINQNESQNNTRLRRNAGSYGHGNLPKLRRGRVQHDNVQEGVEGRKRLSVDAIETDAHHRKLTVLLAADNIEDESQIDLAVHGELASKIVERIFEEVQRNEGLKVALGPGLYRKHKPQESIALDKMYRQGLDEDEVKETEAMMRRVMELLGRLVLDEVRRKTCATLAPDMHEFLQWSLGLEELAEPLSDEVPPLPVIRVNDATERHPADKFLFQSSPDGESLQFGDLSELERKVALLKSLINEYRALTEREKTKVQTVHDYLVRQLALLMKYIESKETAAGQGKISEKIDSAGARISPGKQHILQYQGSIPNRNFTRREKNEFKLIANEASNSSNHHPTITDRSSIFSYFNGNSNVEKVPWVNRRKRKHKTLELARNRRERFGDRSNYDGGETLEYRKLLRRIATLRRKKREDSWGYEVPRIYSIPVELPSFPRRSISTVADLDQPVTETQFGLSVPPTNSSTPVRGKNRLEDEVLLLNKREAWRKENERLLEEVAFGKDTRNDLIPGGQERLFNRDQEIRMKRAFDAKTLAITSTTTADTLRSNQTTKCDTHTENLRSLEEKINVFPVESQNIGY